MHDDMPVCVWRLTPEDPSLSSLDQWALELEGPWNQRSIYKVITHCGKTFPTTEHGCGSWEPSRESRLKEKVSLGVIPGNKVTKTRRLLHEIKVKGDIKDGQMWVLEALRRMEKGHYFLTFNEDGVNWLRMKRQRGCVDA
ncbi:MAG: hypothetical protein Q9220_006387 [cf. Caloplaca sp. 1 TL-2023]